MGKDMQLLLSKLEDIKQLLEQLVAAHGQSTSDDNKIPITIAQAAAYLHLSVSHVYRLIYSGDLQPLQKRKSGRIVFLRQELNRYLEGKEQDEKKDTPEDKNARLQNG